ncbi:PRD domain-containing protein [Psychrilyobacter atlanticus]|uniref:PRD domain-containing protein n=1 Tax=Psychrilyobacter atlanticus TaxID=271091 RepID=UPI0004100830|nr:PRD domain-containing protein [Psychrilyobacter atlanticus]
MGLVFRLELLKKADQIDEEVFIAMNKVIELFKKNWGIELTEENGQMMVTHLSMALMRVKNGLPVNKIDEEVYQEVTESEFFEKGKEILEDMKSILPIELPNSERKYMLVNNTLILENLNEGGN